MVVVVVALLSLLLLLLKLLLMLLLKLLLTLLLKLLLHSLQLRHRRRCCVRALMVGSCWAVLGVRCCPRGCCWWMAPTWPASAQAAAAAAARAPLRSLLLHALPHGWQRCLL